MNKKLETRQIKASELRASKTEAGELTVTGYAAVFNELSEDLGGFREQLAPNCFDNALADSALDCVALLNHDNNIVFARTTSGTLKLSTDEKGLISEFTMPDTQAGRDTAVLVERGDITQMSFAFYINSDQWEEREAEYVRTVLDVSKLLDVSLVTRPAYPQTSAAVRSLDQHKDAIKPQVCSRKQKLTLLKLQK